MPRYNYTCESCGPFSDWRPMSKSDLDASCPSCGSASKRQIAMPFLQRVSRNVRIAHERNERSADEPKVMRREELAAAHGELRPHRHQHGRNMYRSSLLRHSH
jgi:putative FmdB family regulatory protein